MPRDVRKITDLFNYEARGKKLDSFTITLARPEKDLPAQSARFAETLARWLMMQGDDFKGNAQKPAVADAADGYARVSIAATEEAMARIERQFAGEILRADPPAQHVRGAIYPPKVDPWDISKW